MTSLSVITPVLNGSKFIESCITNVINQRCHKLEHLILDGGSTDGTLEIIQKYARRHSHIKCFSEKDSGQSQAMNKGIRMAEGEIIGFLNVDDFYDPNLLNQILDLFEDLPKPAFAVGNCRVWNDEGRLININCPRRTGILEILSQKYPFPQNPSAYFYHKVIHDKIGLYDEVNHNNYSMDLDFILRTAKYIRFHYFDEVWGNFVLHSTSKTYMEMEDKSIFLRVQKIFKRHYQKLTLYQKINVFYIRFFGVLVNEVNDRLRKWYLGKGQESAEKRIKRFSLM
ncbi:glycosyltransferase family 2 protein [Fulvivirgaceae bacterium BMA12]|uniref:Glycosyltransferase family 2 protein n=1 Tax=Agaribacillus aureus TaxID=3051825 RepID=A0ABT8L9T6_9BACT|nr:glycosyltransferase family 2 protein [Fulvivirgaceae bacterium BMA12]